jgi:hypothetical protein
MSWIVQHLIMQTEEIKVNPDIESDDFNNLLIIEKKIDELYNKNLLSNSDLKLINCMASGKIFEDASKILGISSALASKRFNDVCQKISFSLGGLFTDDGYLDYLKDSYNLTDEQIDKVIDYIHSKYRHKIIRRKHE